MSDTSLVVIGGRKRGRPRAPEPRSTVSAWLPASEHDQLIAIANARAISVSEYVGLVLRRDLRTRMAPDR